MGNFGIINALDLQKRMVEMSSKYQVGVAVTVPPVPTSFDMQQYVCPPSGRYARLSSGEDVRCYYSPSGYGWQQKNALWEELWADDNFLYRGFDISSFPPASGGTVYAQWHKVDLTLVYGAPWLKRTMRLNEVFYRTPTIVLYKADGAVVKQYDDPSYMLVKAYHPNWVSPDGVTVASVLELQWSYSPDFSKVIESYFYGAGQGLVGFYDGKMSSFIVKASPGPQQAPQDVQWIDKIVPAVPPKVAVVVTPPAPTYPPLPTADDPKWQAATATASNTTTNVRSTPNASDLNNKVGVITTNTPISINLENVPARYIAGFLWRPIKLANGVIGWARDDVFTYRLTPVLDPILKLLNVPYASQWGFPSGRTGMCGAASAWSAIASDRLRRNVKLPVENTVDSIANWLGLTAKSFAQITDVERALVAYGVDAKYTNALTVALVKSEIDRGYPVICLINYGQISQRHDTAFAGGHILVAIGYSAGTIICNDPDYTLVAGAAVAYKVADFEKAISDTASAGNTPNQGVLIRYYPTGWSS